MCVCVYIYRKSFERLSLHPPLDDDTTPLSFLENPRASIKVACIIRHFVSSLGIQYNVCRGDQTIQNVAHFWRTRITSTMCVLYFCDDRLYHCYWVDNLLFARRKD